MFRGIWLWAALSLLFVSAASCDDDSDYGWNIPHTPVYAGGYISTTYDSAEDEHFRLDDLALLLYAGKDSWQMLGEIEFSDISIGSIDQKSLSLYVERLHVTWDLDAYTTLTLGKFYSDVGFWNLAPINTLTETTTSPYIEERTFPELTTGVMLSRSFAEETAQMTLMLQHNRSIDSCYNNMRLDRHYAMTLSYYGYDDSWRLSGGYFRRTEADENYYAGIAYQRETEHWSIQSELFTLKSEKERNIPYNGYAQFVRHLHEKHELIFRQEFYKDEQIDTSEAISLFGYAYRPRPNIVFKSEYVRHSRLPQNRFVCSFSMVF